MKPSRKENVKEVEYEKSKTLLTQIILVIESEHLYFGVCSMNINCFYVVIVSLSNK